MNKDWYGRVDTRIDTIKDDVAELKAEQKMIRDEVGETRIDIQDLTVEMRGHVAGDNKIVTHLTPIMADLKEMVEDHKFKKLEHEKKHKRYKSLALKLGLVATVLAIIGSVFKYFII